MAVHLWQTALFVVLLAAVGRALRGTSARLLSVLYWTGILKLLLPLPLIAPLSHRLVDLLGAPQPAAAAADSGWSTVTVLMYPLLLDSGSGAWAGLPPALYVGLTASWLAGSGVFLLRRFSGARRSAESEPTGSLRAAILDAGLDPGRVRTSSDAPAPFVRGGLRPVVVLPEAVLSALGPGELRAVLIHEREHLLRRDPLRYSMLAAVRAGYWFYPPLWWLARRIREMTEMACDEAVVRSGLSATIYCRSLARTLSVGLAHGGGPSPVGILGHRGSFLRRRLERIRSGRRFEAMFSHRLSVAAAALAALVVSALPVTPTPSIHARDDALAAVEELDALAEADLPITLSFDRVQLGWLLESIGKTSGVEFRVHPEVANRPVTVETGRVALKLALKRIGSAAGVEYRVLDRSTVEVVPILLAGMEGLTPPVLIQESKVKPVYPDEARRAGTEGRVMLQALVFRDGTVGQVEVLRSEPPDHEEFREAALDALRQWRYEPATRDGEPVDVYFTIRVDFQLQEDEVH